MTAPARPHPAPLLRGRPEPALVVGGAALLVAAAGPGDPGRVPGAEGAVFRVLNGTTVLPFVLVWPVMHLGNVVVVPASAALAATLAARVAVTWPWLGRRGRIVAGGPVAAVSPSRVHVGAHLPLDVVGGAGLGVAVAGVLRLLLGRSA